MFARRLKVEVSVEGERRACPLDWLDSFCMRRFTGDDAFDDNFPQAEGELEDVFRLNSDRLAEELSGWLSRKKGAGKKVAVHISEEGGSTS